MSTPDLHTRAARFFLLAEYTCHLGFQSYQMFWQMFLPVAPDPAAYLPALAAAVRDKDERIALETFGHSPPPVRLPPEAVPWYDALVAALEIKRVSSKWSCLRVPAQLALVRLGGCRLPDGMQRPSPLPEWLQEARSTGKDESGFSRQKIWAAWAAWQPQSDEVVDPKNLGRWIAFWQQMHRSSSPVTKGIAARALLNLLSTETGRDSLARSRQPVTVQSLLSGLAAAIDAAAEKTTWDFENFLDLLNWQPATTPTLPAEGLKQVSLAWLRATRRERPACRKTAWQWLINWDRTGLLTHCGVNLLPHLIAAIQTEKDGNVLWQLAQWGSDDSLRRIGRTEVGVVLMKELEKEWQAHRQPNVWGGPAAAWWAGFRLHRAGVALEPPARFREDYLSAVAEQKGDDVMFVLAQWLPGAEAPPEFRRAWQAVWRQRLGDQEKAVRQVAGYAFLRQALEWENGEALRRVALQAWRNGEKNGPVVDVLRLREVPAQLAAGIIPDFTSPSPVERQRPRLGLPSGRIADREWRIEDEKLKMENHEGALGPANRSVPDGPSR